MYKIYHQCIPSVYDVLEMINQAITYLNLQNTFSFTAVCKIMDKTARGVNYKFCFHLSEKGGKKLA